jgi:hypothetical protein
MLGLIPADNIWHFEEPQELLVTWRSRVIFHDGVLVILVIDL